MLQHVSRKAKADRIPARRNLFFEDTPSAQKSPYEGIAIRRQFVQSEGSSVIRVPQVEQNMI
jgi:hypothetical protein